MAPVTLDAKTFREKTLGCWIGKAVGGTLGMPYEGRPGTHDLTFYQPVPTEPVPNDDLDLQVLWACLLDQSPVIERRLFERAWRDHVGFPWDEYGVAIRNLRLGIPSPWCGRYDNYFINGMGAAIRSEIWACLAPGDPALAARYAQTDAEVDHDGDGLAAALFLAALESAAFVESDAERIVDAGLAVIPQDGRLAQALADTRGWCKGAGRDDWRAIQAKILAKWEHENFTDVVQNMCFIAMALLLGKGDFDWSVCAAVNCGKDTDCTGATVGALLGILAPDSIDEKWLKPISRALIVDKRITGIKPPATLDGLTDLVVALREKVKFNPEPVPAFDPAPFAVRATREILPSYAFPGAVSADENAPAPARPAFGDKAEEVTFGGQLASLPASMVPAGGAMLLRFPFTMPRDESVRVVFNTRARCLAWVDDAARPSFARPAGGALVPSPHRVPADQFVDMDLSGGLHTLTVLLAPVAGDTDIDWVVTVADGATKQWMRVFQ